MTSIAPADPATRVGWRLDSRAHSADWRSGIGAGLFGGRWNSRGMDVVYASFDPSTAILEVAVHKGFRTLDAQPHVLTAFTIASTAALRIVRHEDVPNPNWLRPGTPTTGQQAFGDSLLREHGAFAIPSVVSSHAWNLLIRADRTAEICLLLGQEPFALDPRLTDPTAPTR